MNCYFCGAEIQAGELHMHHVQPLADGGDPGGAQVPVHRECHHRHHRENGDYARWKSMDYACRVATFGLDEVTKILAYWGRKGYEALPDKAAFHSAGGRARAANGRDSKGRFVAVVKE